MIKPDAVEKGYAGKILDRIIDNGFRIIALQRTHLSRKEAEAFYAVHKERPFYGELVEFMTSGPVYAAVLEKENAVQAFRDLIGATDPEEAGASTIRKDFAESKGKNAVHGSDSDENAQIEGNFFFATRELL